MNFKPSVIECTNYIKFKNHFGDFHIIFIFKLMKNEHPLILWFISIRNKNSV